MQGTGFVCASRWDLSSCPESGKLRETQGLAQRCPVRKDRVRALVDWSLPFLPASFHDTSLRGLGLWGSLPRTHGFGS